MLDTTVMFVHFSYKSPSFSLSFRLHVCTLVTVSSRDSDRLYFMEEMKHFEVL